MKKLTSKTGEPLDERKLFNDAQEIKKMYQKTGYQKTEVRYLPPTIDEQAGRGTVIFEIKESPKVKIDRVEFVGAENFTQRKLRRTIKTRKHWMFSWIRPSPISAEFSMPLSPLSAQRQTTAVMVSETAQGSMMMTRAMPRP